MKKVVSVVLLIFIFVACEVDTKNPFVSNSEQTLGEEASQSENVPFSDEQELSKFNGDNEIIHYKIARKLGMLDLDPEIADEYNWGSYIFSAKPVIIYGQDSRPLYYEFVVLSESKEQLGTVTINARKNSSVIVRNIFPYIRDYDGLQTKGANYRFFGDYYPTVCYYGIPSKAGDEPSVIIDPETNKEAEFSSSDDQFKMMLENATQAQLDSAGISNRDSVLLTYNEKVKKDEAEAEQFWGAMDSVSESILEISDEEIQEVNAEMTTSTKRTSTHTISSYDNNAMDRTFWSGACGPTAVAWVYRGKYSSYKGTYLPLYGDGKVNDYRKYGYIGGQHVYIYNYGNVSDDRSVIENRSAIADNGLYADIFKNGDLYNNKLFWTSQIPMWPSELGSAMRSITNGNLSTSWTCWASTIYSEIKNGHPVISLSYSVRGWNWYPCHWKVIFGAKKHVDLIWEKSWWQRKRGWSWLWVFTWIQVRRTSYQFKIHDNGTLSNKSYWENSTYTGEYGWYNNYIIK